MSIELMLNAVNLTFIVFSRFLGSMEGQVIVFFVMAVAAAEAVVDFVRSAWVILKTAASSSKLTIDINLANGDLCIDFSPLLD